METLSKIKKANIVITSDLKRSIDSAKLLNLHGKYITDPLFREVEIPANISSLKGLTFKPATWSVISRLLWFCGYSRDCESLIHARVRAEKAANVLVEYAKEHTNVVLVGHGFFNMLIAKELRKMGFRGRRKTNSRHWGITTFSLG
ncbi:histidine phosphatase family protein [Virgibacillus sp. 179-BFC.A HS]|uniref:Histidine phosphatase family protein n=1 Tax=Tigheibacillus jepli TaxID=3035914 RepID=A0ABU5CK78_9BACI|nr:histidine phosphatase family protein [Virgibacillus sp. 179-BFC.A HS]MDY0406768.1 histidine phosphatase family protein [Virgibacillus sp. 179-BFC.A HS]